MTQVVAATVCESSELGSFQNYLKLVMTHFSLMANLVMNVAPNRSFAVTMNNVGDKFMRLLRDMMVGICMPSPVAIVEVDREELPLVGEPPANWRNDVNLGEDFVPCRAQAIELHKDFAGMWSGKLAEIDARKHGIDLKDGSMPQYQHPYLTGLKGGKVIAKGVKKM